MLVICDVGCYGVEFKCWIVWGGSFCVIIVLDCCVCVYVWLSGCDYVLLEDVYVVVYEVLCYCVLFSYEVEVEGVCLD